MRGQLAKNFMVRDANMSVLLKAIHARGGLLPASIHVFDLLAAPGVPLVRSTYSRHPSRVHMYTRRQVAAEKGIVEAIPALAIVASFAYLLPTNLA